MDILQNVKVKQFLQSTIFTVFTWVNRFLNHNKRLILFYINTDLRESNKSLLEYLIDKGYNKTYQIICACNNPEDYAKIQIQNVRFTNRIGGVRNFFRAGYVFYSIGKIPIEPGKNQQVMQMWHGTPLKGANEGWRKNHTWKRQHYTWLLSPSKHFAPVFSCLFSVPQERIFVGGYPRCDALFKGNPHYDFGEYHKIILWAPTFRKSIDSGMKEFTHYDKMIPVLKQDEYNEFDKFLASIGIKVVVKLHPYQYFDKSQFSQMNNFILLSHQEFCAKKMDLYRFAAQSDALITDYSSIYFDYLLLDRPIAFTEDDIELYGKERGFAVENPNEYKPGFRIKTKNDLMQFCIDLANGKDCYKEERERVNKLVNDFRNGSFCQRILDKMGIRENDK